MERQITGADGGAGMTPVLAEYLNQQVRSSINNIRLFGKIRSAVYEGEHFDDFYYAVQVPEVVFHDRKAVNDNLSRCFLTLLNRQVFAKLALVHQNAVDAAVLAGQIQKISCTIVRNIGEFWLGYSW